MTQVLQNRKEEHIRHALQGVEGRRGAGWDDIELVHEALPELDLGEIDLSVELLGRRLRAPLIISAMTGGHPAARDINSRLARAARRFGLGMGVGSQRTALADATTAHTYEVARQEGGDILLLANLGAAQLVDQQAQPALTLDDVRSAIAMIEADALAVHLNFVEELVQPEGDRNARGCLDRLAAVIAELGPATPVLVKETGAGISPACAAELSAIGVSAIDVGGRGGTSFAAIEGLRAADRGDPARARLGELLRDWGIPTPVAVLGAVPVGLPVIASGGVRSGLDAARAIALGATAVGVAGPVLRAAMSSEEDLDEWLAGFVLELRAALMLTSSPTLEALRSKPVVVLRETRAWCAQLGLHPRKRLSDSSGLRSRG